MTARELRENMAEQIADGIYDSAVVLGHQGQINHYEVIKSLVGLVLEKGAEIDALEKRLDEVAHDVRRLERDTGNERDRY